MRRRSVVLSLKMPAFMLIWLLLAALLSFMATGCAVRPQPLPGGGALSPAGQDSLNLRLGQEKLNYGLYAEAAEHFLSVLRNSQAGDQAQTARLGLAKAELGLGHDQESLNLARDLTVIGAAPEVELEAGLLALSLEDKLGLYNQARSRALNLLNYPPAELSSAQLQTVAETLSRVLTRLDRHQELLVFLLDDIRRRGLDEGRAASLINAAGLSEAAQVRQALTQPWPSAVRQALNLGLVRSLINAGDFASARSALDSLQQEALAPMLRSHLAQLENEFASARQVDATALGLILPLSGANAATGQAVAGAVELGLGLFDSQGISLKVYLEDSKNDPRQAVEAFNELALNKRVMAVMGPLEGASSLAVARRAQELGVPVISLSQVEGLTRTGNYIFRNFFSAEDQINALLDEVMLRRGLKNLAIMAPDSNYGRGYVKLFDAGVAARGGRITASLTYGAAEQDFSQKIKMLLKLPMTDFRPGPDSPQPVITFDALFIPDVPERLSLIAPQLNYYDVKTTLLGTAVWHSPKLAGAVGDSGQTCIFPDGYDPDLATERNLRFVADFDGAFGRKPNVLDAHGYDIGLLVRTALNSPARPRTRESLRTVLNNLADVQGVCGPLTIAPDRRISKPLTLFTLRNGLIMPLPVWQPEEYQRAE